MPTKRHASRAINLADSFKSLADAFDHRLRQIVPDCRTWTCSPPLVPLPPAARTPCQTPTLIADTTAWPALSLDPFRVVLQKHPLPYNEAPASKIVVSIIGRDGSRHCLRLTLEPDAEADGVDTNEIIDLLFLASVRADYLKRNQTFAVPLAPTILTASEREVLEWIQNGKTTWETATILKISSRTVKFHLANASVKLNANTRTQAVASALSRGLIRTRMESSRIGNLN